MTTRWSPEEALAKIRAGAMKGVIAGTELVLERATDKIMDPPKTGRIYRRRGVEHQASAPGEAPASDVGTLAQSGATYYDPAEIVGRANWSAAHAPFLEYGTQKMEPRPFARTTLEESRPEIEGLIETAVAGELAR
jgi:HK97 gp10 family phage protein